MNRKIHPVSTHTLFACSNCGNEIEVASTLGERVNVEVCSGCHPAYTGKVSVRPSGSRIEAFNARYKPTSR